MKTMKTPKAGKQPKGKATGGHLFGKTQPSQMKKK